MKLDQNEKDDLKALVNHRGFKILEKLAKDMEYNLLKEFKTINLASEGAGVKLNGAQNKLAGAEYLINTAKSSTQSIVEKK